MNLTEAIQELRHVEQLFDIDFEFADYVVGKEESSPKKECLYLACLCLSHFANQQHSMLPLNRLNGSQLSNLLSCDLDQDLKIIIPNDLEWDKDFPKTVGRPGEMKPLIFENDALYLHKYFVAEQCIADAVSSSVSFPLQSESLGDKLNQLFGVNSEGDLEQPNWQKVAAFMALRSSFCVISGGPGTGKTTTVGKILILLLEQDPSMRIDLLAPTGKAADRLGDSIQKVKEQLKHIVSREILDQIPKNASTIHRYLGYHGFHRKFLYNENKKRGSDLLLIDESSMVSLPLFRRLLLALKEGCRVILLGDKDQLTAVETGNVLGELTQAKKINTFSREFCQEYRVLTGEVFDFNNQDHSLLHDRVLKLEHSYRFNENQGVGKLSALINRCDSRTEFDEFNDLFSNFADISLHPLTKKFSVSKELSPDFFKKYTGLLQKIPDLKSHEDAKVILECLKEFRVLCASRVGRFGVEKLNQMLSKDTFGKEDKSLYHGRCVMILQNNRHLEVYNGDVGVVLWKSGIPHVYFEGGKGEVREFNPTILPQFETAFAMTVHKSQGSEYDQICLLLQEEGRQHVQKELIYTGVTRAKSKVKIFSQKESFLEMCRRKTIRYSGIAQKLRLN